MSTLLTTNFPHLTDSDEFESLIRDICTEEWNDPHTEKFGRKGQKQYGVDVYGSPLNLNGVYRAAQCKLRTKGEQLTANELEDEVQEAKKFPHELDRLIIVTDALRDKDTQIIVDKISEREVGNGGFKITIWFWDNVTERLAAYPNLIVKYYKDFFANLSTLPDVERLLDKPLQIITVGQSLDNLNGTFLRTLLNMRGVDVDDFTSRGIGLQNARLNDALPDGVVFHYAPHLLDETGANLLKFASNISLISGLLERDCPVFVMIPSSLEAQLQQYLRSESVNMHRIKILSDEMTANEIADQILKVVFQYGYVRRGSLVTINIAIRSRVGKPNALLLDLDWHESLSIDHFPTPEEWQEVFVPALKAVREQLLAQSDRARIQMSCQLPLPAAFALGFYFNVRVARIGVWARKTAASDFKQQFWWSDGNAVDHIFEPKWLKPPNAQSQVAIVELTSYVAIHNAVKTYLAESQVPYDTWVQIHLEKDGVPTENIEEDLAVAYANQVGQVVRQLNERGVVDIHIFARIPSSLAVLIGQRLLACGRIHLYWFANPTYRFAFTLI
jgi:hypothetical protein